MSITAGQNAVASDFITNAQRNGTKSNDSGRVPKLESDGYLHNDWIKDVSSRLRLGGNHQLGATSVELAIPWDTEDFDTASIHDGTGESTLYTEATEDGTSGASATSTWFLQEFTVGAGNKKVTRATVKLGSQDGSTVSAQCHIRSSPTGSNLASSQTVSMTNTAAANKTFYFSDYTFSAGTYYLIIQPISLGGGTLIVARDDGDSGAQTSANSGSSWTPQSYSINAGIHADTRQYLKAPETGKYLILATINAGMSQTKTVRLKVNNTVIAAITSGDASFDGGIALTSIYSLTANDIVTVTLNQSSSASDDVQASGSSFEIIRIR